MDDLSHFTQLNRHAWNEIATVRSQTRQPAQFFLAGGSTLDPRELAAAGDVNGMTLLHLQCATGEDTLSWAQAGAQATGVDISDLQIALAQQKAAEVGLAVRFVASDIYALPGDLQQERFDLVYTGGGALVWLPDLTRWAQTIVAALKPSGRLLLFEEHPVAQCLTVENGTLHITSDYFSRAQPDYDTGWRHFQGGENATATKVEFGWPLGDVVTALAQAGLRIESLQEYPSKEAWRFQGLLHDVGGLPGEYLLIARKETIS
jgi:SAM-dependent methyltransferase